jgi:hypothetical protein
VGQSKVLFLTLNIPGGSNNDADAWYGAAVTQAQNDEIAQRTQAERDGVEAIVISSQADVWGRDGRPVSHIANYEPFIASVDKHTAAFGKPVLLFEGDSHHYRSDNPLKAGQPCVFETRIGTATGCSAFPRAAARSCRIVLR